MKSKYCLRTVILFAILCMLASCGYVGKGCRTADQMIDQTIFNADKHVWTYEQFYETYERYQQYETQIAESEQRLADFNKTARETGIYDSQEKSGITMELNGSRQMKKEVAKQYNKMSDVCYQKIWKGKGLPEKLEY